MASIQTKKCEHYKLATQNLCSQVTLHKVSDLTRHEPGLKMKYKVVGEEEDEEANADANGEPDTEMNASAYEATEQAGLLHLAHGWIQRGNPKKVSRIEDHLGV